MTRGTAHDPICDLMVSVVGSGERVVGVVPFLQSEITLNVLKYVIVLNIMLLVDDYLFLAMVFPRSQCLDWLRHCLNNG